MKRLLLIPLFAILALTSCERLDIAPGVPECMVEKTKKFNKRLACDDGASVKEFIFQGKTVYVLSEGNCIADSGAEVIDSDCNHLGYLGGFVGNIEINGVEFSPNATLIRTIWEN